MHTQHQKCRNAVLEMFVEQSRNLLSQYNYFHLQTATPSDQFCKPWWLELHELHSPFNMNYHKNQFHLIDKGCKKLVITMFLNCLTKSYVLNPFKPSPSCKDSTTHLQSCINPLSTNPTKWPNALKQFVGKLLTNCLSVFGHFLHLALKGLIIGNNKWQSNNKQSSHTNFNHGNFKPTSCFS